MTATFAGLHDVAQVVAEHIRVRTGIADVRAGMPREPHATTQPGVRITLLHTAAATAPRNEPTARGSGGRPGPLRLTCVYLLTTSGADGDDPGAAHTALGRVLQLLHEWPVLQLPVPAHGASPAEAPALLGEGRLGLVQVAMTMEQVADVWGALHQRLQPCVVLEAGPFQLAAPGVTPPTTRPPR